MHFVFYQLPQIIVAGLWKKQKNLPLFCVVYIQCLNYVLPQSVSFLILPVLCSEILLHWMNSSCLGLRKFSTVNLLYTFSVPLDSIASPTPMIHRFGISMVSQMCCVFHTCFLSIFSLSLFEWSSSSVLSSIPDSLLLICSILLVRLAIEVFNLDFFLIFQDFVIFVEFLPHFLYCIPYFIQLFILISFDFFQLFIFIFFDFIKALTYVL